MPSFKPKANKKILSSKKLNITVDSKHQEKLNEFENIDENIIPKLKKERCKLRKQLQKENVPLEKVLKLKDKIKECSIKNKKYKQRRKNYLLDNSK